MKSISKFAIATVAVYAATAGSAFAFGATNPVPEPGSLALVGLAIGALAFVARKKK